MSRTEEINNQITDCNITAENSIASDRNTENTNNLGVQGPITGTIPGDQLPRTSSSVIEPPKKRKYIRKNNNSLRSDSDTLAVSRSKWTPIATSK